MKFKIIFFITLLSYLLIPAILKNSQVKISSDLTSLLDKKSPILNDYYKAKEIFPKADYFILIFQHQDPETLAKFHQAFNQQLENEPVPFLEKKLNNISKTIRFFNDYSPLYYGSEIYQNILNEAQKDKWLHPEEKKKKSLKEAKQTIFDSTFIDMKSLYYRIRDQKLSHFNDLPQGNFISKDGQTSMVLMFLNKPLTNFKEIQHFTQSINELIEKTKTATSTNDIVIMRSGDANTLLNEYNSLWHDLAWSISICLIAVFVLLYFYLNSLKNIFLLLHALLSGLTLSSFILLSTIEELNTNAVFLILVIIGNSINVGIILSYYIRAHGLKRGVELAFSPTVLSTLGSILAFSSLSVSSYRGYQDLAFSGTLSIIICFLSSYIVIYSYWSVFARPTSPIRFFNIPTGFIRGINLNAKIVAIVALIITALSIRYFSLNFDDQVESDMTQLKDKAYTENTLESISKHISSVGLGVEFIPSIVLIANDMDDAKKIHQQLNSDQVIRKVLPELQIYSISTLLPENNIESYNLLKKIRSQYKKEDLKASPYISKWQEDVIEQLYAFNKMPDVDVDKIPEEIRELFTSNNGKTGNIVYLSFNLNRLEKNIHTMRAIFNRIQGYALNTDFQIAGQIPLLIEMEKQSRESYKTILATCLIGVILIILLFSDKSLPLFLTYLCTFITMLSLFYLIIFLTGTKINILNFVAIPLTLAIGIDYMANIANTRHIADHKKKNEIIFLTIILSATTLIGYLSIYLSTTQMALKGFSQFLLIGEVTTIICSIVVFLAFAKIFKLKGRNDQAL